LDAELEIWQQHWTADWERASQLNTPEKVLPHTDSDIYPNTYICAFKNNGYPALNVNAQSVYLGRLKHL